MRINRIKQFFPGDKLLDVGCGFGFFLYVAKETWDSQGIELSDFASDFARDLTKTKVVNADFLNVEFSEESFGIITMWDFIEHVSNPLAVLRKANKIMKMHGLLVISTPDVGSPVARILGNKWYLLVPPLHLFYFNSDTISMLLKKSGFDIEKIEHKGKFFNIMYLAYRLGHLYPRYFSGRLYKSIVEQLSRIGFLANRSFYINTGDIMTVYAKKRKKIE
ncbi:MAG: class I SAM-dependent methyltransferase [Candidatus Omnitrophica bacterium]|nr:class I SAM-dependent methyltransferase [Candidatus Omnitrophota bacterium]